MSRPHALVRWACGALVVCGALGGTLGMAVSAEAIPPAGAIAPPGGTAPTEGGAVTPLVDCLQDAPLGAVTARTVVLGYRSDASTMSTLAAGGGDNEVTVGASDRGQPSAFDPGVHHGVWALTLDAAAEPTASWRLDGHTVPLGGDAPSCTDTTVVTVSADPTPSAGDPIAVTAVVSRMLLSAPESGAVQFSLDGGDPVTAAVGLGGIARAMIPLGSAGPHTITARYLPAQGSTLRPATASTIVAAALASGPLSVAADSVVAGSTEAVLTVSRMVAVGEASVEYVTADGTAHAGSDYTESRGTIVLADGQASATVRVPLVPRAAGAGASVFFVLLQRSSAGVASASATVSLPAVATAAALGGQQPGASGGAALGRVQGPAGPASSLPAADPTASGPASMTTQDLFLLVGAALVTVGGVIGLFGLFRAVTARGAGF